MTTTAPQAVHSFRASTGATRTKCGDLVTDMTWTSPAMCEVTCAECVRLDNLVYLARRDGYQP